MASCAACSQPILQGQQFALDGTEVFHRACVRQSYRSALKIAQQQVRDLEAKLADTRRAAARVEVEANIARNQATNAKAEVLQLRAEVERQRDITNHYKQQEQEMRDNFAGALQQMKKLADELAVARPVVTEEKQEEDPMVQRFKLLELD